MERMSRQPAAHQSLLLLPLLAVIAALALLLIALTPQQALAVDAPGANGTVKIHDDEPEPDPEIRNQPQVCDFHVHGFNFDEGHTGRWWIQAWPPTEGASPHRDESQAVAGPEAWVASEDDGTHAWEWRTVEQTLDDGHYKLFVEINHPTGNGATVTTYKHKVFWVDCPPAGGGGGGGGGGNDAVGGGGGGGEGAVLSGVGGPGGGTLPDTATQPQPGGGSAAAWLLAAGVLLLTVTRVLATRIARR